MKFFVSILLCLFLAIGSQAQFGGLINAAKGASKVGQGAVNTLQSNFPQLLNQQWDSFKSVVQKTYATAEEEALRKNIFSDNFNAIEKFNNATAAGLNGFKQGINLFSDLLNSEFNKLYNGYKYAKKQATQVFTPKSGVTIPESVDWREKGAVGPVRNQNQGCAGCYAFASAGAVEAQTYKKTGKLPSLSVQNLIDCTGPYGNSGCQGGIMNAAYEYIQENKGVNQDQNYPYETKTGECRYKKSDVAATCKGWVDIEENNEKMMEMALATEGPLTAAIDASKETFQFYKEGIYDDPACGNKPEDMNHGVLIVGYGKEPNGKKYWLVRNSYGPTWGIDGYVKIAKDNGNQCGIAIQASYPLV